MNFTLSNLIYNNKSTLPDNSGLTQLDYVIVWTETAGTICYVKSILLHNTSAGIETVKIFNVPRVLIGSAADFGWKSDSDNRMYSFDLDPCETKLLEFKQPLILANDYDSIQAYSTTADVVTIQIYGARE